MKRLLLASNFVQVADQLLGWIPKPQGLKAVYIATASEPYETAPWVDLDKDKLIEMGFQVSRYEIKGKNEEQIYSELKDIDVVLVCGGNTFYLLQESRKSGFDKAITRLVNEGKIYLGSSAGSLLVGPSLEPIRDIDKLEKAPELKSLEALNIVDFIVLPHFDSAKYRVRNEKALADYKDKFKMLAINENQAVIVEGDSYKVI